MKRHIWLKNPETGTIWDLLPDDPYDIHDGCALINPNGFGYSQDVTQEQVEENYFISQIKTKNIIINGVLFFNGDEHLQNFQKYIGDFRRQFILYYSPSGEYEPYDILSSAYYKPIIITSIKKGEKTDSGWYECDIEMTTQSDVWSRNVYLGIQGEKLADGEPLVYPYIYPYVLDNKDLFAIDILNDGREIGCIVKIKNRSENPLGGLEWFIDNTAKSDDGRTITTTQRAKWCTSNTNILLQENYELYVDSNAVTQEAKVNFPDGTSQSVVAWQEPSWDYINFVRIKHGQNRMVFYIESNEVDISIQYQEQKELI